MLRLRPFQLLQPKSVGEAVALLASHGDKAKLIAGGTDLLPNLKLGMHAPDLLVSLRGITALQGISIVGDEIRIGALTPLDEVATSAIVREKILALATAAESVSSPQLRRMGTLGGNICLDTRCRYINQTELFREALGGCLKSHGAMCHVVPGGKNCVAALSSDTVPPLVALDATVEIEGPDGGRTTSVESIRGADGVNPVLLGKAEVLTCVRIRIPSSNTLCVSRKWAVRSSIDFPLVSLALRLDMDEERPNVLRTGRIVLGSLGPKPRTLSLEALAGQDLDDAFAERIGELAFAGAKPLPNIPYDPAYRRERIAIEARRATRSLIARVTDC